MILRNFSVLMCLLIWYNIFSQNICGKVMYKEEARISLFYQTINVMEFNKNVAFTKYLHYKKAQEFLDDNYDPHEVGENEDLVISSNEDIGLLFINKEETFFTETWWKTTMIVKESPFKWNWKLLGEKKKIGKFNCQNASIKFRGRTFIAWFTTDIPIGFGPYKFKGLPGLILEVYDSEKLWYMKAIKMNLKNSKKKCPIKFDTKQLKKAMNIPTYLRKTDSLHINYMKREASKQPKGSRMPIPGRCDRYYNGTMVEIYKKK